ncbi:MAG: hypothetical protein KFH87_03655 [Bacteroidetes bacterium]|nr:hypothetical protein [Bacteroidota bacterium]
MNNTSRHSAYVSAVLVIVLGLTACTDNPLESDPTVSASKRRIEGNIRLSDRDHHEGVYVWLSGFDISTTSRSDGAFTMTLPSANAQTTPGGNSGVYRLYGFLGNYSIGSVTTAVRDGGFLFPSTEVDEHGNIREDIFLRELFSITTTMSHEHLRVDSAYTLIVQVQLHSTVPPVDIFFPRRIAGFEGPVLLHNLRTGAVEIHSTIITGEEITDYVRIGELAYNRAMLLTLPAHTLQIGEYEVIPYLLPRENTIPHGLLESLGKDVSTLGEEYVYYPFLRNGGRLVVHPG